MTASCSDLFDFYADIGSLGQGSFCSFEPHSRASMWQGNSVELFLHIFEGGVPVPDLASVTGGTFQALGHRDNAIGVQKAYPGEFTIDDPEIGIVRIPLSAAETDAMIGEYDLAVEFTWASKANEWVFKKTLNIMRDQILFPNT